jgi:hypothetical protein
MYLERINELEKALKKRPLNITCQFKIWYGNPIISKLKFKDFKKLYPLITFLYNYTNSTY